ncbi:L-proline glycine betaine ABC transport system permease protein ProW (TC 3.A.1.12.1) [Microbacterium esteraromaticum]|uniref:L-proline glycine betaine ABC transport system permease protein ProW (TC 3.A.1.12.1) n=1 Tax=Microbacterium esteraromaticum TaxID=57043 RepID=A0A1R4K2S5_9MICO|nr:glycine betaine ABC transporter substrate-binding protein [Microbacterium esteraromaticum]SJN38528.1 L-proline glycine betaine ABC transport system permease protein ProW (TC 3.A.1.12.1) [Microbacterium esteraromaticum]
MNKRHLTKIAALGAAAALVLTGCASGDGDKGDAGDAPSGDAKGTITMGFLPAWTDGLSTAYLLADQLEKLGYDIDMEDVVDAGPLYTALAQGDVDMYPSAWSEVTHASYMEEYGDKIEDLGTYYDGAVLTMAVPEYMTDINSIEDLNDNVELFDGKIIGIEPGAGLTKATQEKVIPEYKLDDYELVTSSTGGMLATLDTAVAAEKPIVVTLWRPFWANSAWPMKDLKDPKGALGDTEGLHFLGKLGFAEEFPEAADFIEKVKLTDEQYGELEGLVTSDDYKDKSAEAVDKWIEDNADQIDWLIAE